MRKTTHSFRAYFTVTVDYESFSEYGDTDKDIKFLENVEEEIRNLGYKIEFSDAERR